MASRGPVEITRHYGELSQKETDTVVKAVASLIVGYLETDRQSGQRAFTETPTADPHQQAREKEPEA